MDFKVAAWLEAPATMISKLVPAGINIGRLTLVLVGLGEEGIPIGDACDHAPREDEVKLLPPEPLLLNVVNLELAVRRHATWC